MRRRRRRITPVSHERWLVSYADFITLLFAFFVVLYASSQVDQRKVGKLALAIQVAFQELGVFPVNGTTVPLPSNDPVPSDTVQMIENVQRTSALGHIVSPAEGTLGGSDDGDLGNLRQELEKALSAEIFRKDVLLRSGSDGLVVSLQDIGFFESGSAQIRASAEPAFDRIVLVLRKYSHDLRIEGHTDDQPIHTPEFSSNWELSTARATQVVRLLIVRYGFAAERLSAAGYAQFHAVADNRSAQGRTLNRRVDIVILRKARTASPAP